MAKLYVTNVTYNSFVVDISGLQETSERYSNAIYMVYRIIDDTTTPKLIGTRIVADGRMWIWQSTRNKRRPSQSLCDSSPKGRA